MKADTTLVDVKVPTHRGHPIELSGVSCWEYWVYSDTKEHVADNPHRECGHCGLSDTPEGHDGCLGRLPGVTNACCGHGDASSAYAELTNGKRLAGQEVLELAREAAEALEKTNG